MNSAKIFFERFFAARGLSRPDGRPLYQYRITPDEVAELERVLDWELRQKQFGQGRITRDAAMAFCLWASEWWYQNYTGGPWKWEPVLDALRIPEFAPAGGQYHLLRKLVTTGLRAWRRRIYRSGPSKGFLATIMCEGGLPLNLVRREDSHLSRYLKGLLEEFRLLGGTGTPRRDLASRLRDILPRAWRRDFVYELAGELIESIWRLQAELSEGANPVEELDAKRPGWRDELPIRVSDEVAEILLNGLLTEAVEVDRRTRSHTRWNLDLVPVAKGGWELRGSFQLPTTIRREALQTLLALDAPEDVPAQINLGCRTEQGTFDPLAWLTEERVEGDSRFRLESLPSARQHRTTDLTGPRWLIARSYDREYDTDQFPGASGLGELAWIFTPTDPANPMRQTCRLAGQGTVRVGEAWALVATEAGAEVESAEGTVEPVGNVRNAGARRVYRVQGRALISHKDGSRVIVETDTSADAPEVEYHVTGRTKQFGGNAAMVFLGGVTVHRRQGGRFVEAVPEHQLEWKPDVPGGRWGDYSIAAVAAGAVTGGGRLRYVANGSVRHSVSICILPRDADLEIRPSSDPSAGEIRLLRFGSIAAAIAEGGGVAAEGHTELDGYRLRLRASGDPPRHVLLVVDWREVGRLTLSLPFPARHAAFFAADGHRLPVGARLAQGSLAGVNAEIVAPDQREYVLRVEGAVSPGTSQGAAGRHRAFVRRIPSMSYGHHRLDLGQVDLEIAERLELGDGLDATARLRIADQDSGATFHGADIYITRFDLAFCLVTSGTATHVTLDELSMQQVSSDVLATLVVELLALLDPDRDPLPLRLDHGGGWRLPDTLAPGPYLICGRQGGRQRVCPLHWYVRSPDKAAPDPRPRAVGAADATVADGYAIAFSGERPFSDKPFRPVVRALAKDPAHRDWPLVFGYLSWTALPPMFFGLLRALARNPTACAMAAADAREADFLSLWERLQLFPFAWWQLPLPSWDEAYSAYAEHWRHELREVGDEELESELLDGELDRSLDRVKSRLPGLAPALDFLNSRVTSRLIPPDSRRIVIPEMLDPLLQAYAQQLADCPVFRAEPPTLPELPGIGEEIERIQASHPWSARLFRVPGHHIGEASERTGFLYAPGATAVAVVSEGAIDHDLARRIRGARRRHTSWFDATLEVAQLLAFGLRGQDRIRRLSGD